MGQRNWTTEEVQQAKTLYAEGQSVREIAIAMDRTVDSVRRKLVKLHAPSGRSGRLESSFLHPRADAVQAGRPTNEMLRERDIRNAAPVRDLTGLLLGDPPVGYAALDVEPLAQMFRKSS